MKDVSVKILSGHTPLFDLVRCWVYFYKMQVNIHETKTRFSKLIIQASKGEEIIVSRAVRQK